MTSTSDSIIRLVPATDGRVASLVAVGGGAASREAGSELPIRLAVAMATAAFAGTIVWHATGTVLAFVPFGGVLAWLSWRDWRAGLVGSLIYSSVAGAVIIWLAPSPWPHFIGDLAFIYPAYVGFLSRPLRRKAAQVAFPWFATVPFVLIVLLESMNPQIDSALVPLLGIKVWLSYVPVFFLGRALIRTRRDLRGLLWALLTTSLPATLYGLYEFRLAQLGELTEGTKYGTFAGGYIASQVDAGYFRISSLFSSSTQFDGYLFFTAVVGAALLLLEDRRRRRWLAMALLVLVAINVGVTGDRKLYLTLPFAALLFTLLERNRRRRVVAQIATGTMIALAFLVLGAPLVLRVRSIRAVYEDRVQYASGAFETALAHPLGIGTGQATDGTRYLNPNRIFLETLPSKTVMELGVLGLVALILFYGAVARASFKGARRCSDSEVRSVATLFAVFVLAVMLSSLYGYQMDLDPLNVDTWLAAGLAAGLAVAKGGV